MFSALLVEDDRDLSLITKVNLTRADYDVDVAYTCAEALEFLEKKEYDLIMLDEVLPDKNGDELCSIIRDSCECPIIFMSCLDDSKTKIKALRSGGDDYMVKPVCFDELLARADAIIRRSKSLNKASAKAIKEFKQFSVDTVRHKVLRDGDEIELSSIEYDLLVHFMKHPNSLLLYQQIYESVWGSDSLGDIRTVMVHISNLRKKIDPNKSGIIETVRGAGYIFSNV